LRKPEELDPEGPHEGLATSAGSWMMAEFSTWESNRLLIRGAQCNLDQVIKDRDTTRSVFICEALRLALRQLRVADMERKHAEGYARYPVEPGEFNLWETEQVWGEP